MTLLTIAEFAKMHGQPRSTVYRWIEADPPKIPVVWQKRAVAMIPEDATPPQKQVRHKSI